MDLRIQRITIELADETGAVRTQVLAPGEVWNCGPEETKTKPAAPTKPAAKVKPEPEPETKPAATAKPEPEPKPAAKAKPAAGGKEPEVKAKRAKRAKRAKVKAEAKAPEAKPPKPKAKTIDLTNGETRAALFAAILAAVSDGPKTPAALSRPLDLDRMTIIAALTQMVDEDTLVTTGRGATTRYGLPGTVTPEPVAEVAPEVVRPRATLRWKRDKALERETYVASWGDDGLFRAAKMSSGPFALFHERNGAVAAYGCGELDQVKSLARELAQAGLPTPEQYRASGGDLSACQTERRLRMGTIEMVWRETVEDGRQICLAAAGDGEMRLIESAGGSFILAFVREGDTGFDSLGCGSRASLEARALDVLAQATATEPGPTSAPTRPQQKEEPEPATPEQEDEPEPTPEQEDKPEPATDASKDALLMDQFADILGKAIGGA